MRVTFLFMISKISKLLVERKIWTRHIDKDHLVKIHAKERNFSETDYEASANLTRNRSVF